MYSRHGALRSLLRVLERLADLSKIKIAPLSFLPRSCDFFFTIDFFKSRRIFFFYFEISRIIDSSSTAAVTVDRTNGLFAIVPFAV